MSTDPRQVFQERVAAIFTEAEEKGFTQCDLLPLEVQDHFQNLLKTANNRISALEDEAEQVKKKNQSLETQLKGAQLKVENMDIPEDATQLQAQLDLAKQSAKFYAHLMNEAEERATKYQKKWKEALQKQTATEEADKNIAQLEEETRVLQQSKSLTVEEMRKMKDLYDNLRDKDLAAIVVKEEQLMASKKQLKDLNSKLQGLEEDSSAIEGQYHEVMSSLDAVVNETTEDLNTAKAHARVVQQQKSATFSEIQPLRKFFGHAHDLLDIFQVIFKQLLNATEPNVIIPREFPEMVTARLQAASEEYKAFLTVRALLTAEGVSETEHSEQLDDLAKSAQQMHKSLDLIGEDLTRFLWALSRKPDLPRLIRMKFSVLL